MNLQNTVGKTLRQNKQLLVIFAALILSPPTRSLTIQGVGLAASLILVYFTLKYSSIELSVQALGKERRAVGFVALAAIVFLGYYLWRYEFIPTWDETNYWQKTLQFNEALDWSVHGALLECLKSISNSDYNQLQSWILSLPARIFPSWAGFAFCSIVLFSLPAALVVSLFVYSKIKRTSAACCGWLLPACFLCVLFTPVALRPGLSGLVDAPAYLLMATSTAALMDERMPFSRPLQTLGSICLCGAFLLRRYMLYSAMGLAVGVFLYWLIRLFFQPRSGRALLLRSLLGALITILIVVVVSVIVFPGFYYMSLFGGQVTAYRSWTLIDSLSGKVLNVLGQVGLLWIVLAVVCLAVLVTRKVAAPRPLIVEVVLTFVSCSVAVAVSLLAFWQVQDLGVQHWYVFLAPLTAALALPPLALCASLEGRCACVLAGGACTVSIVGLLGGLSLLGWLPKAAETPLSSILPWDVQAPFIQSDVAEKKSMTDWLERETGGTGLVYFACASGALNSTVPLGCVLPELTEAPFPVASADVDSRDGFNTAFFEADFVVTSDPVSLHLAPESELVVTTLNSMVRDSESFVGRHYEPAVTFELEDGVRATVYRRVLSFSDGDIIRLRDYFDTLYPGLPELFHDRFDSYLDAKGGSDE